MTGTLVPVIDLAVARDGKSEMIASVDHACRTSGFLVVVDHGVPTALIDEMYAVTKAFFRQPTEIKRLSAPPRPDVFRGYRGQKAAALARSLGQDSPPDLVESFVVNRFDDPAGTASEHDGSPLAGFFAPNIWPAQPEDLRDVWERYYRALERVADDVLGVLALVLGLPADWFVPFTRNHRSNLLANYYPAQHDPPLPGQLRRGAHTDYGSVTVLYQDDAPGGLQVQRTDGSWYDVQAIPGSFVVNLGDLMARWTNDQWASTMHRVVNPPANAGGRERLSIPFFHIPDVDARIEAIPTCIGESTPARYDAVEVGAWFLDKHLRTLEGASR